VRHICPAGHETVNEFFLFINDLHKITTKNAKLILYADDAVILVSNISPEDFKININKVFYRYK